MGIRRKDTANGIRQTSMEGLLLGSILAAQPVELPALRNRSPPALAAIESTCYDEQGSICPEGLKRAVYAYLAPHPRAGETVEGCWRADSSARIPGVRRWRSRRRGSGCFHLASELHPGQRL